MPTKKTTPKRKRNYKKEYADCHGTPEQKKKRAQRNSARASVQKARKKAGKKPLTSDQVLDHKKPIRRGGTNAKSNTRVVSRAKNAGWRKGKKGYD